MPPTSMRIDRTRSKAAKLQAAATPPPSTDPRVTTDELCVVCDGVRSPVAVANDDPFCSTDCCRRWYDAPREADCKRYAS